jgi:hypothetical protein
MGYVIAYALDNFSKITLILIVLVNAVLYI